MTSKTMTEERLKAAISVSKMCRILAMSRSQFYWHVRRGTFHTPLKLPNGRPYYNASQVEDNLKAREMGIGVSGGYVIFYERGEADRCEAKQARSQGEGRLHRSDRESPSPRVDRRDRRRRREGRGRVLPQRDGRAGRTRGSPHDLPALEAFGNCVICEPITSGRSAETVRKSGKSWPRTVRALFGHCLEMYETPAESVRKMNENQDESCADLRKISAIILHSPESGIVGPTETTQQATSDDQLVALWLHGRPEPPSGHTGPKRIVSWGTSRSPSGR